MVDQLAPSSYTTSSFHRARWNVLDLITIFAARTIPASIFCEIDMEAAENLRQRLSNDDQKITITAVILKAIAIAQKSHPLSRSYRLGWGRLITTPKPAAGFTVERMLSKDNQFSESGEQAAVFFGVIDDTQTKPLHQIASELAAYGSGDYKQVPQLAKEHFLSKFPWISRQIYVAMGLNIPFLRTMINRATFGVTSLGKYGATTIIAPNVCTSIFGVGTVEPQPVVIDHKIEIRKTMTLCYSFDSLIVDTESAAHFVSTIRGILESGLAGHLHKDDAVDTLRRIPTINTDAEIKNAA